MDMCSACYDVVCACMDLVGAGVGAHGSSNRLLVRGPLPSA